MDREFIKAMQKRIASTAVGASTARRMGPKGTIAAARMFLANVDLSKFSVETEEEFEYILNRVTRNLRGALPDGARHWGSSRKFLNIFLRGTLYNRYLCRAYNLRRIEPWLEIPLDSHVVKGLRKDANLTDFPRWESVIGLTHHQNRQFQRIAKDVAKGYSIHRVHLDLFYWRSHE